MIANLVKCSRCGKILSSEFFRSHECEIEINNVKNIPVIYFHEDDESKDRKSVTGRGVDGVLYRFILNPKRAIRLSDDSLQPLPSDEDFTEPFFHRFITVPSV